MTFIKGRRLGFMYGYWGIIPCALVLTMLCFGGQAQTPATIPTGTAPAAAAVIAVRVPMLPDAVTGLTSSARSASQSVHILVGRSMFIKSMTRLKRVYVSNPEAVDSFTSSPKQIVVTAKAPGVSSLILWDEAGESMAYLVFSDLDVSNLEKDIHQALPNDDIRVDAALDRITLSGTVLSEASSEAALKLAGLYAKTIVNSVIVLQAHIPQVKLKVQIIEIDRSKLEQFGINLFSEGKSTGSAGTGQFPSIQTYTPPTGTSPATFTSSDPLNLLFYNFGLNIGLTLQDLQGEILRRFWRSPRSRL